MNPAFNSQTIKELLTIRPFKFVGPKATHPSLDAKLLKKIEKQDHPNTPLPLLHRSDQQPGREALEGRLCRKMVP